MAVPATKSNDSALRKRNAPPPIEISSKKPSAEDGGPASPIGAFIKLGRPKFLPYSAILLFMGTLFASQASGLPISWSAYALALGFVWTSHLQTHYNNEYFDLQADLANDTPTKWTGGSRVLVNGLLPTWSALLASVVLTASAIVQIWAAGWKSIPVHHMAALILSLSWSYTSPPFRVHYHSLGEVIVAAVLTTLVPLFGFATQPGTGRTWESFSIPPTFWHLIALLALQQWARMVVMNIPDVIGDLRADKVTFAARVGVKASGLIYGAVQVALVVLAPFVLPPPLALGFLSLSYLGLKTAVRVVNATQNGSWGHTDANVDIPFKATMQCAGTAAAVTSVMLIQVALGRE
ncbi:UbiA prenyltransferase family-domain-containing protein [Powellomyces hirtus]|nr:UbiA prenyltransferase family-domain-containing protein [Powellomyces hirtus]